MNSQLFLLSGNNHKVISIHSNICGKETIGNTPMPCRRLGVERITNHGLYIDKSSRLGSGLQNPTALFWKWNKNLKENK